MLIPNGVLRFMWHLLNVMLFITEKYLIIIDKWEKIGNGNFIKPAENFN